MQEQPEHSHGVALLSPLTNFGLCVYNGPGPELTLYYAVADIGDCQDERHYWDGQGWNNDVGRRKLWSDQMSAEELVGQQRAEAMLVLARGDVDMFSCRPEDILPPSMTPEH